MTALCVVITCYKEGELLNYAIDSLSAQTDRDFRTVIVNGCSPDEATNRVCSEIQDAGKALIIRDEANKGLGFSRNNAFEKITEDVVVFLDADDTLPFNAIACIRETFDKHPEADFIFGNYEVRNINNELTETVDCSKLANIDGYLSPDKLATDWKLLGTSPCRKRLWQKIGGYDLQFSNTANDVDFWQRAILAGASGYFCDTTIYNWNRSVHGQNSTKEFLIDLEKCNYKNIDFVIRYSGYYKDGLSLAVRNKNYSKAKDWGCYSFMTRNIRTITTALFCFCPLFLLPLLVNLYELRISLNKPEKASPE
jgi:glycosyltransferase involved in cell wall biosynthesis